MTGARFPMPGGSTPAVAVAREPVSAPLLNND
jgi:hypothetical protein